MTGLDRFEATVMAIIVGTIVLGVAGGLYAVNELPEQPARDTTVRITRIVGRFSRWHPYVEVIEVQAPNGVVGETSVRDSTWHCKVGDTLPAEQIGTVLDVDTDRCGSNWVPGGAQPPYKH